MSDLQGQLDRSFAGQYHIGRELGSGGMSRVFTAREDALDRDVVIKVLSADLAATISSERFAREIQLVAELQHPHIVPILTAGVTDGIPYFVMPFVPGQSLRDYMRSGRVPRDEACRILCDVATALEHAHSHGIVHRDIKPENVLLNGRTAIVADFGIAKAISVARAPQAGGMLTTAGSTLGTPAYMAPEQVTADSVDGRADLYSWGILAYEMLAGRHPFAGKRSPQQMMSAHVVERPAKLSMVLDKAWRGVQDIPDLVMRCLEKDPDRRPQSASEVLQVLDGGSVRIERGPADQVASVAVLPFANVSNDPDNDYFSDGVTEEIISALARSRRLRVAGRASSFSFKGKEVDLREAGERLNVQALVEGSVRRVGNRVRVTAEVVNASDGFQLWSEQFDRELTDVFALQDEIAQAVVAALSPAQTDAANATPAGATHRVDPRAYDLYLRGKFILSNQLVTGNAIARALANYREAVALAPDFAPAYAALAGGYLAASIYLVIPTAEAMTAARAATDRAMSLEPDLADAHTIAGYISFMYDWDWDEADRRFRRALELKPNDSGIHGRVAMFEASRGAVAATILHARRAVELDPLSAWIRHIAGGALVCIRHYDEGRAYLEEALELDQHFAEAHRWLSVVASLTGDSEEALARAEQAAALTNRNPWTVVNMCIAHAMAGRRGDVERCVAELAERRASGNVVPLALAFGHMLLGDADEAFTWLDKSVDQRDFWLPMAAFGPQYDLFRGDPRFAAVLRRIGTPTVPPIPTGVIPAMVAPAV
ncbi:MAG: tetratricopeptide repeat-containing serine/threonine-protein kinase [Gemmatimonadaceae bacterium]|nr:tetratricopeptide repeat-containing serine/threonine-protein kinase [Gemmatimonadaceae bacterium]